MIDRSACFVQTTGSEAGADHVDGTAEGATDIDVRCEQRCAEGAEAPRFYEALEKALRQAGLDREFEGLRAAHYDEDGTLGRRSVPPGVYFR